MIEPPSTIGCPPVVGPVAPPSEELLFGRHVTAHHVHPIVRRLHATEAVDLSGRVADHFQELLVRPHIGLKRRDVEVADQDVAVVAARMQRLAGFHLVEEFQLVVEFRIERGIGDVAAGGHVEIMQHQRF